MSRSIFDEFLEKLVASAERQVIGDPRAAETTMGPLVSHEHRDKVLACYRQAVAEGAKVVIGGGVPKLDASLSDGAWVQPTIWTGLREDSRTVREEIFGPCCHVAPFDDDASAIAMANDTRYGLAATVWSADAMRAGHIASSLNAGVVWINGWMIRDLRTAFGGFGKSGIGREGGMHAMEFHTELKNICEVTG